MTADAPLAEIQEWAARRRLPAATLHRWLALDPRPRAALLELARGLRLRTGQFLSLFELLEEIAVRENDSFGDVLARDEIRKLCAGPEAASERARRLFEALRRIRFPRLRGAAERLDAAVAALGLPAGVRVELPRDLESDELRLTLAAHGSEELQRLLEAVAHRMAGLCRIADGLGGNDEL